jgi:hypothetical protein
VGLARFSVGSEILGLDYDLVIETSLYGAVSHHLSAAQQITRRG